MSLVVRSGIHLDAFFFVPERAEQKKNEWVAKSQYEAEGT